MNSIKTVVLHTWQIIRTISGDDAYERYLEHWHKCHAS
ncbi:MAG: CstA-like transporter-associated (seleno)protein [Nitrosomonadaceae bacterium]